MTQGRKLRLGGMALRNGLLVHGPEHWAVAVRRADGTIGVASGVKPRFSGAPPAGVPGLRGGDLAAYHGVEHKAIGAYEQDAADAREAAKEHDRCGSHLMAPLLAANLAGTALLRRLIERPSPAASAAVQLASLGAAVEVFAWSERHAETAAARALRRPGHELQRVLGTREPTDEQLEVGRAALAEILRVERG